MGGCSCVWPHLCVKVNMFACACSGPKLMWESPLTLLHLNRGGKVSHLNPE